AGWDWRSAGSIEVLLSASAVTEAVGPGKGWTADAGRLLVNAIEWAREAQLDPPAAPVVQAGPATGAESGTVTGTSERPAPVTVSRWVPEWDVAGGGPTRVVRLSLAGHDRLTAPADAATLVLRDAEGNEVRREPLRWAAVFYLGVLTRLPAGDHQLVAELSVDGHLVTIEGPPIG